MRKATRPYLFYAILAGNPFRICHDHFVQSLLNTVADLMREKNLPGLMIGGHAITALGHARATFDLDLLIPRAAARE